MYVVKCGVPDAPVEKFSKREEAFAFALVMIERDEQTGISDGAEWSVEEEPELVPNYKHRFAVEEGLTYDLLMPLSECAMHMRIAGKVQRVRAGRCGVYLVNEDGSGGPHMTDGEAGVLNKGAERYAYGWKVRT